MRVKCPSLLLTLVLIQLLTTSTAESEELCEFWRDSTKTESDLSCFTEMSLKL